MIFNKTNKGKNYDPMCKKCRLQTQKDAKKEKVPVKRQKNTAAGNGPAPDPRPKNENQHTLVINFSDHQDLLEKISRIAGDELRTVPNQILYWLKTKQVAVGSADRGVP